MKVAVVTPTIGAKTLWECVESVQNQTYENLTHYLFLDGKDNESKIWYQLENATKIKTIRLEENVGKGWYGHRVYAACSFLVNADVICYLDEDNWIDPNHVEKLVQTIDQGHDWAFSLRKIYSEEGTFLCEDNCESLGQWPVYFDDNVYHIDTGSFAIKKEVAVQIGHAWYGKWGADRQFFMNIKKYFPNFGCSKTHSLNYRLGGNEGSVKKEFFEEGNKTMLKKYPDGFPWLKSNEIIVGPGISIIE